MTASQVEELKRTATTPTTSTRTTASSHRAMDEMGSMNGGQFKDIFNALLREDRYMALADLRSYHEAQQRAMALYRDQQNWNRMSLVNIAGRAVLPRTGPFGITAGISGTPPPCPR